MYLFLLSIVLYISYRTHDSNIGSSNVTVIGNSYKFFYPCGNSFNCTSYIVDINPGIYQISLWGAQGGHARNVNVESLNTTSGGLGGYTSGIVYIWKKFQFHLYIGGRGEDQASIQGGSFGRGGFNGGGDGGIDMDSEYPESGAGGGGATDLRLNDGNDYLAMKTRVMVAGGGGGANSGIDTTIKKEEFGGHGGGYQGSSWNLCSRAGTQTSGYKFGVGQNGMSGAEYSINGAVGGGGGGFYGASSCDLRYINFSCKSVTYPEFGGAGGSSYISGHSGCISINETSTELNQQHTSNSIHYSGIYFRDSVLSQGNETFPSLLGGFEIGHSGHGAAVITVIDEMEFITCHIPNPINLRLIIYAFYNIIYIIPFCI